MTAAAETIPSVDRPSLVAAVFALLQRYTDRSELAVGYVAHEGASLRPLALALAGDETFAELAARVRAAIGAAEQEAEIVSELDAVVAIDQSPPRGLQHPPWLEVTDADDGLGLQLHRNGLVGEAAFADEYFAGHLRTLLAAAMRDSSSVIGALPLLTEAERHRLLVEWNDTTAPYPQACLHELIQEQVVATPESIAVEFGDERLTYRELDSRANQLAHHLTHMGVGQNVLVGICLERSIDMLIALLGVMKAGGAYVPIDPDYPTDRQEYMLTHSEAPIVVTQERLRGRLALGAASVVVIDTDWPTIATRPAVPSTISASPDQLAYVIYTSGSTGKPKGVQIPHRALVNFLVTMRQTPGLTEADALVAVTTLSFDIAGLELYLPLITGARLVIASAETSADPRALAALLERSGATVLQATPTTWRLLVDSGWTTGGGLKGLCGGEALPAALANQVMDVGVELWNMYGPTETTIWSTCVRVRPGQPITIGRPIGNTTLYVLDPRMNPVPIGATGELWIGGDGVADGYRGRPDLTEERFVPDPFAPTPGARLYKTGDLARYRDDGEVAYLGRIDHQVKVRGFRIELGEIETVLSSHPAVGSAVVSARGSGAEAELAAYVTLRGVPVAAHALRQFLTKSLPAYMVPSTVTVLESFPLTPNGKVDRNALPEPTRERSEERELVAPRTELERRLAEIWERELSISPIGVTDNFFDLGVTSIVAATLFAAIEHDLSGKLPLGAIFRAPTIQALATLLEGSDTGSRWTSLVPIQPNGSQPPIFCIHGGGGTILHLEPLARRLGEDQPFYGLQSKGLYGGVAPPTTVEAMANHYLSEMRQVHPGGPWRLAGYCFGTIVAFDLAQRLVAEGEKVELVAMFNGPSPIWIRKWGWFGNQPSRQALRPAPVHLTTAQRLRRRTVDFSFRLRRALREPRRLRTALVWHWHRLGGQRRVRIALALGRPLPEQTRENYFLHLHAKAERLYEPQPFDGDLVVFYGDGLYEEPELGWGGLASRGVLTHAVPGQHDNNRQVMMEPYVDFVSERLREYLGNSSQPDAENPNRT